MTAQSSKNGLESPKSAQVPQNETIQTVAAEKGRTQAAVSWRQVEKDLRKLQRRGLSNPRVHDLETLLELARALSNRSREAEQIEEVLSLAIDGYTQPERNIVRLWFGLAAVDDPDAPDTREMTSTERHTTAWEYAGSPGKESTFRSTTAAKRYEGLAKRLARLHDEALAHAAEASRPPDSGTVGGLSQSSDSATETDPAGETSPAQPATTQPEAPLPTANLNSASDTDVRIAPGARRKGTSDQTLTLPKPSAKPSLWRHIRRRVLMVVALGSLAGGATLVATSGSHGPPAYHGIWGPHARPIYNYRLYIGNNDCFDGANPAAYNGRCGASADFPVFNSFVNTPYYGDERMFFDGYRYGQRNSASASDPIRNATSGDGIVVLRVYVDNDSQVEEKEPERTTAYNTRVRVYLPATTAKSLVAYAYISANRAITVYDSVDLTSDQPFSLEYIPGSAVLYSRVNGRGHVRAFSLSDEIIGSEGALIGLRSINGELPPEKDFSGATVEIKVRAVPESRT